MTDSSRPQLVLVVGPTASGKTALACALAQRLDAEVISADSQQCYLGLDVGTAKPSADERAQAPHHLLDIAPPEEQLDAATFIARADAAIADVHARGKRALVVGGTGLWIRALVRGLVDAPGRDESFRSRLRARIESEGLRALYAELGTIDPEAAARILPGDRVRIERALEVYAATGQTISALQRAHRFAERRYRARVVLLDPPRPVLWQRIEQRTRALFAPEPDLQGTQVHEPPIIVETRALLKRVTQIPSAAKALGIIGYTEAAAAIEQGATQAALDAASLATAARTRQYAKRQRTWFKKDAPALDETGVALAWPPPARDGDSPLEQAAVEAQALDALCSCLREWYEGAR
jgi:tRNA dimethylallyltransferase